ncbi:aminodeoxychorismate/anthranilate synthase component II [Thalassotalea maritima]|uniref:aminodeoxychorismate/anthranilate synthase component II n=1 Tax=Thalassotalea maritima TaxID=3242416 RepID=UPI003528A9F9
MSVTLFMLDNLDSFTYNLVDEFKRLDCEPIIYRNTVDATFIYQQMQQQSGSVVLVLSPGPGSPEQAGCMMELIDLCVGTFPILGICLGHQALVQYFGGRISRAESIVHGKASNIQHQQHAPFQGLKSPLPVARYHSLIASEVPSQLSIIAEYQSMPMAVCSETYRVLGLQFHPESLLTSNGSVLMQQSLDYLLTTSHVAEPLALNTANRQARNIQTTEEQA